MRELHKVLRVAGHDVVCARVSAIGGVVVASHARDVRREGRERRADERVGVGTDNLTGVRHINTNIIYN